MSAILLNPQFLVIGATNLCMFLILASWSFLPVYIVDVGGSSSDAGLVMGSMGITSLGCIPFLAPLIDKYGRRPFIVGGVLAGGVSNAGFLLFDDYSHLMILVRLAQGVAFAACFNGCSTAVVDMVPDNRRAQGIGLFAVSSSLAISIGPYLSERVMLAYGFGAYFALLVGFGLLGFVIALFFREPERKVFLESAEGFFPTAIRGRHFPMMITAATFGSGFAAMNTFFPLYAENLGLTAGAFFITYGISLLVVRLFFGSAADRVDRKAIMLLCMLGFGIMLFLTSRMEAMWQTLCLGALFGLLQGLSYPAMMARMVDRSTESNRAVVVGLFTGSFGVGINASVLLWGYIADVRSLQFMYAFGGVLMFIAATVASIGFLTRMRSSSDRGDAPDR